MQEFSKQEADQENQQDGDTRGRHGIGKQVDDAYQIIEKMNVTALKLHAEEPMCPTCGGICELHSRQGVWKCCEYSITTKSWDVVRLHASVVKQLLIGAGIEHVIYQDVALDLDSAVSHSHLLPLFVFQAQDVGEAIGMTPLLSLREITDEACNGNSLLPVVVALQSTGCSPDESLALLCAATRNSIANFRSDDATGSAMDFTYLTNDDSEEITA